MLNEKESDSLQLDGRWENGKHRKSISRCFTWSLYSLVMIRIYANFVSFLSKCVFTVLNRSQLVVRLKIRPTPQPAVNYVWQTLSADSLDTVVPNSSWIRSEIHIETNKLVSIFKIRFILWFVWAKYISTILNRRDLYFSSSYMLQFCFKRAFFYIFQHFDHH